MSMIKGTKLGTLFDIRQDINWIKLYAPAAATTADGFILQAVDGSTRTNYWFYPNSSGQLKYHTADPGTNYDSVGSLVGEAGTGATVALDNLANVAINTSLVSDTDATDNLGSTTKRWLNLYLFNVGGIKLYGASGNRLGIIGEDPAANRILTVPDPLDNDTFAMLAASQTLTNKTIDGDDNTLQDIALTSLKAGTQGNIIYFNGTNWVALAVGDSGKFLKTQGAGANPMWDSPSVGTASILASSVTIETGANDYTLVSAAPAAARQLNIADPLGNDTFVFLAAAQTLTNKTLTSPVLTTPQINDTSADHQYVFAVSELAADRTVTLPLLAGNDVFVFADFIQTLTNKTLTSPVLTTPQINDTSADHQYVFAVSELAADRTVTLPLLAGNDVFVFADFIQTLTNKTISAVDNTVTNVNAEELETIAATNATYGIPITIVAVNAGSATVSIFNANAPFKFRVIDAWAVSTKAGNAGTWVIDNGTNNITSAISYGVADTDISRAVDLDDAYHEVAANGSLRLISSNAADTAIVYISVLRITA